jgi:hypothetical protein
MKWRNLDKQEQVKSKVTRQKEIIMITAEINEMKILKLLYKESKKQKDGSLKR